ncbi:MAG: inorganic phosphate transporter [Bacteroidales bacterium]|nr:inorganic phosphate transporter [Bacteroidales bacterium]MDD4575501.1 inorganic phosphate transporter [Bacteroidales bacterium]
MLSWHIFGGLFLGWSLGTNGASNVFGSAVGSRMITYRKATILCAIFVVVGALIQGSGATGTINSLGNIDVPLGSFTTAFSAALSVYLMSSFGLPVSTSQVIVGSIIGWNLFSGQITDINILKKFFLAWAYSPILGALFSVLFYLIIKSFLNVFNFHLLRRDAFLRYALIFAGILGSYSLGANNIANVMGVFVSSINLPPIIIGNLTIDSMHQLFLLGGLAISLGVLTYSHKTMTTLGKGLFKLSTEASLAVVLSYSAVLYVFSSTSLKLFLESYGLPSFPLVPVSSSQTVVGAIIGIGLLKNAYNIKYSLLGKIVLAWLSSPIIAGMISFLMLFLISIL